MVADDVDTHEALRHLGVDPDGPDGAAVLDGRAVAEEVSLIGRDLWGVRRSLDDIVRLGLDWVRVEDVRAAARTGHRLRLVAAATPRCATVEVRCLAPDHPLFDAPAPTVHATTAE